MTTLVATRPTTSSSANFTTLLTDAHSHASDA